MGRHQWIALGTLLMLAACSDSSSAPRTTVVPTAVDPATAGTIQVDVRYDGPVPPPKQIDMRSAAQCAAAHPEPVYEQSLLVHDGRLENAVVWIKSGLETWVFAAPTEPVRFDQRGCEYHPHVAVAMVSQPVVFVNSDSDPHNVHGQPEKLSGWNFMMSRQGTSRTVTFDKPEIGIPVGCDIHPWMRAYLSVVTNPYFAVTPASGAVTLRQVPPGDYVIGVWQEKLGSKEEHVTLTPSGSATVQVTYKAGS